MCCNNFENRLTIEKSVEKRKKINTDICTKQKLWPAWKSIGLLLASRKLGSQAAQWVHGDDTNQNVQMLKMI